MGFVGDFVLRLLAWIWGLGGCCRAWGQGVVGWTFLEGNNQAAGARVEAHRAESDIGKAPEIKKTFFRFGWVCLFGFVCLGLFVWVCLGGFV